jgi:hypothetical protein
MGPIWFSSFLRQSMSECQARGEVEISSRSKLLAVDRDGRTMFVADAHRDDGKRFVVRANEKLTAFLELEAAIRTCGGCA